MDRVERETRRDSFLGRAEDYFLARPGYPHELLRAAVEIAGLEPGASILDVGCGTGEASEWFADSGFAVLGVDRSAEMVRFARRRLAGRPDVEIRCQDFEEATELGSFAALVCATSYHWLDPETRVGRCVDAIRPGGALVLLWHTHPFPYTGFFQRSQPIYRRWMPDWTPPATPGAKESDIRGIVEELESSDGFADVHRVSHDWSRTYPRELYLRLINTYSDHRLLPSDALAGLRGELSSLIDDEFGGAVVRPYRTEMIVALRSSG